MRRIYDAKFAPNNTKSHHSHLGWFWWVEGDSSNKGIWTRDEAHDYVVGHPETVYVAEGGHSVYVYPHHYNDNPSIRWIQTKADGLLPDNLVSLAKKHRD